MINEFEQFSIQIYGNPDLGEEKGSMNSFSRILSKMEDIDLKSEDVRFFLALVGRDE